MIGAGAVGLAVAITLARRGIPVTVAEAGDAGPIGRDYIAANDGPNTGVYHEGIHRGRVKGLGGTTTLWGGQLVPFGQGDFQPAYPGAPAWPVKYDELAPWFDAAYSFLGLDPRALQQKSVLTRLGIAPDQFGEGLTFSTHIWLKEPDFTRLFAEELKTLPSLTILTSTEALRLEYSKSGRVTGVQCLAGCGADLRIAARQVVLANGTMEISRQLLRSASADENCPFADNKYIGRGFVDHLHGTVGYLETPDRARLRTLFDTAFVGTQKFTFKVRASDGLLAEAGISNCAATINGSTSIRGLVNDSLALVKRVLTSGGKAGMKDAVTGVLSAARVLIPVAWRYLTERRAYRFMGNKVYVGLELEQIPTQKSYLFLDETQHAVNARIGVNWDFDGRELEALRFLLKNYANSSGELASAILLLTQKFWMLFPLPTWDSMTSTIISVAQGWQANRRTASSTAICWCSALRTSTSLARQRFRPAASQIPRSQQSRSLCASPIP